MAAVVTQGATYGSYNMGLDDNVFLDFSFQKNDQGEDELCISKETFPADYEEDRDQAGKPKEPYNDEDIVSEKIIIPLSDRAGVVRALRAAANILEGKEP